MLNSYKFLLLLGDAASPILLALPLLFLFVIITIAAFIIIKIVSYIKNRKNKKYEKN